MQPDVLVSLLTMSVEPTDSSYMPSLMTISAGNSVQSLHELRTITVEPSDRRVVLLDGVTQVTYLLTNSHHETFCKFCVVFVSSLSKIIQYLM